jgi:hypothetical protein
MTSHDEWPKCSALFRLKDDSFLPHIIMMKPLKSVEIYGAKNRKGQIFGELISDVHLGKLRK